MDLATILKAISFVADLPGAAIALYEGFIASTDGVTQDKLKARYAEAKADSDALHAQVQTDLG